MANGNLQVRHLRPDENEMLCRRHDLNPQENSFYGNGKGEVFAASSEVREEGGVAAEIKEDLGEAKIFFKFGGENIFKTLHYYLMEYVSGGPEEHDWEVKEALWVPLAEVKGLLSYRSDKEMLVLAAKIIHAQNI